MTKAPPSDAKALFSSSALWRHQQDAALSVESFLTNPHSPSFVVSMPTGSGKSGVIAVVAQAIATKADVLLLTPWAALVSQLQDDVAERFWRHSGFEVTGMLRPVRISPSNVERHLESAEGPTIWISTFAGFHGLTDESKSVLAARLGAVLIDEGHYEPAKSWAKSVRSLQRPIVLFTATPFRNDYKYFAVEPGNSHHYSLAQAIDDAILRTPIFDQIGTDDLGGFVDGLIQFASGRLEPDDRIIVRCATAAEIRSVVSTLNQRGETAIGVHERFGTKEAPLGLLNRVPREHGARYWVHQFKLIEGIDDPRFRCLAFYSPLKNGRSFVQQVGRVLRGRKYSPNAWVLGPDVEHMRQDWTSFLDFDLANDASQQVLPSFLDALPNASYIGGSFRRPIGSEPLEAADLSLPKAVTVMLAPDGVDVETMTLALIREALEEQDCFLVSEPVRVQGADFEGSSFTAFVHMSAHPSPFLRRQLFLNVELGVTTVTIRGTRVYLQSSVRLPLEDQGYRYEHIGQMKLAFPGQGNFQQVTLANTDMSVTAERTRTQAAASLSLLAPDLGDYMKAPSTIVGMAESVDIYGSSSKQSRYVGFGKARVRESGRMTVERYLSWLAVVDGALSSHSAEPAFFSRYAQEVECADPDARNVLISLDPEVMSQFAADNGAGQLQIAEQCVDVVDGMLQLEVAGLPDPLAAELRWADGRFWFDCVGIDERFRSATDPRLFSDLITQEQAFSVLVEDKKSPGEISYYSDRRFVVPRADLSAGPEAGIALKDLLRAEVPAGVTSEKGGTVPGLDGWETDSLFDLICKQVDGGDLFGVRLPDDVLLVCDDSTNSETADFYLVDSTSKRLAAIHAKAKSGVPGFGASGLHEVVAQAQKNLRRMVPGGGGVDRHETAVRWTTDWRLNGDTQVVRRVRSEHTPEEAADLLVAALRDPGYSREVWIVVSGILSKQKLLDGTNAKELPALQALYLIQSAWASAGSIGARLSIICND
ncbi:DEAD/DEAH box helicase [Protaetiibacter intestinalis]|uniref:DEAD/DEAH box helicase n=1 Tax=Protaetiibacter intestinalis TaxID=2419774 RepID=A0A387B104_9MICO|nr:DEAD/DEAH box helicase family protein [Protaetiibacter intestinalis]AYF97182.1 DEAD/DEAH box helicase [Protaetiibacter intestinalis]